jgi:hypothetical protein
VAAEPKASFNPLHPPGGTRRVKGNPKIFLPYPLVKKLAAILVMGLLAFNWMGYRMVFTYLEHSSSKQLNAQLDQGQYAEESLITIKIPVDNLPYYTNSPIFERVKGQVSIGGMQYQYVERRIFNDSLEMRCIPNAQATHLNNAREEFFKLVNDLQHTSSSGKPSPAKQLTFKNILTECLEQKFEAGFIPAFTEKARAFNLFSEVIPTHHYLPQEQPPDGYSITA